MPETKPDRMDPLAAVRQLEERRATEAKLAKLRQTGIRRDEWDKLPPAVRIALRDGQVKPVDPTPAELAAEFAEQGKRVWSRREANALLNPPAGKGALAAELWGQGVKESLEREIQTASDEGRIFDFPRHEIAVTADSLINPDDPRAGFKLAGREHRHSPLIEVRVTEDR